MIMIKYISVELYPEFRKVVNKFSHEIRSLKNSNPDFRYRQIKNPQKLNQRKAIFQKFESQALKQFNTYQVIHQYSVQAADILIECKFYPIKVRKFQSQLSYPDNQHIVDVDGDDKVERRFNSKYCTTIKAVMSSIYEGKKCFTYFSDLYDNNNNYSTGNDILKLMNETMSKNNLNNIDYDDEIFLREAQNQMVFDLSPSIELVVKAVNFEIWDAFVDQPLLMTGRMIKHLY